MQDLKSGIQRVTKMFVHGCLLELQKSDTDLDTSSDYLRRIDAVAKIMQAPSKDAVPASKDDEVISKLRDIKKSHGWSYKNMGKLIGVHSGTIGNWMCGFYKIGPGRMAQIKRFIRKHSTERK